MTTSAVKTQGTVCKIGTLNAQTTAPASDTFLTIGEVIGVDGPGGSASVIDATHFASVAKEKLMGLPDEGQVTLRMNVVPDDVGLLEIREARSAQELRNWRITLPSSAPTPKQMDFKGFAMSMNYTAQPDGKWELTATIEISGAVTWS